MGSMCQKNYNPVHFRECRNVYKQIIFSVKERGDKQITPESSGDC